MRLLFSATIMCEIRIIYNLVEFAFRVTEVHTHSTLNNKYRVCFMFECLNRLRSYGNVADELLTNSWCTIKSRIVCLPLKARNS